MFVARWTMKVREDSWSLADKTARMASHMWLIARFTGSSRALGSWVLRPSSSARRMERL